MSIDPTAESSELDLKVVDGMFESAAGFVNAQHGRLVAATAWLLEHEREWQGDGLWTPEAYVRWRTGVGASTARRLVDIARQASEFPSCVRAMQRGELSLDQLGPIVRHAPGWCDAQMAEMAVKCTVAQISKIAREYSWGSTNENGADDGSADESDESDGPSPANVASEPPDEAWYGWDDHGRFRLHVNVGADTGMLLEAALAETHDALFHAGDGSVDTVDAVVEMASRSIDSVESPARRNRYRVNVHIDADGDRARDARGRPMSRSAADRITCDALLSPIRWEDGVPVSVGRTQHIVPERTRRIVEYRDGGCAVPGCHTDRYVEVHHIVHWSAGGTTDTANLICLCPRHHRLHHQGRLGICGDADATNGVEFTDANGQVLQSIATRPGRPGAPPPIEGTWQHPLGERLDFRWVAFRHPKPPDSGDGPG